MKRVIKELEKNIAIQLTRMQKKLGSLWLISVLRLYAIFSKILVNQMDGQETRFKQRYKKITGKTWSGVTEVRIIVPDYVFACKEGKYHEFKLVSVSKRNGLYDIVCKHCNWVKTTISAK